MTIEPLLRRLPFRHASAWRAIASSLPRPARPGGPALLCALVLLALLAGAWLWLRDSALVAVKRVSVSGVSGPDAARVRSALTLAARDMTTLDVRLDSLRTAVAPFPAVKGLSVSTQFPHGLRIRVTEQIPVGVVLVAGRRIAVAGDGTLLHDAPAPSGLPSVPLRVLPGGPRVTERDALHAVEVLAAAPYQLLPRVTQVSSSGARGLVAQLRNGPSIYFGDASRLAAKWSASFEVLADPGSAGASYLDVTDPERPAAGGLGASATGGGATPAPASGGSSAQPAGG